MLLDRLTEGAEHHPVFRQLLLVGGGNRNAVENSIHRNVAETLLLAQRNAELVEGFQQLGIHLIEAGLLLLLLGSCVINDVLIIDLGITKGSPIGLLEGEPVAKGLEPELQQKVRLFFLGRDQANDLFTETFGDLVGLDLGDKAVLVRLADEIPCGGTGHSAQPAVALIVSVVMVCVFSGQAKGLSSVRKSMQWHSLRSRIGTQGQFQKA